ncbi:MAG TPA: hypothetical protein VH640_06860 [Bryobacteraceae bacterium]
MAPLILLGCATLGWTATREIAAFQDIKGNSRPATYNANGAATITCVRAVQSAPLKPGDQAPACYITGPGLGQRVSINASVHTSGPGTVTLTCTGVGQLGCRARVSD